jgi:PAS domain S-box-containing protein
MFVAASSRVDGESMTPAETKISSDPLVAESAGGASSLLDLLVEQVVDYAIFVIDPNGNIASWNPGAERIKGYSPEEIVGKPYAIFFSEEDRRAGKPNAILAQARTLGHHAEEGWRIRKDGTQFWASIAVTALRDDTGALKGFAKITRDLTEQRLAEQEARRAAEERAARRQAELDEGLVRRSRDQLDLILRSIAEGVTAQTPDGRMIFANDAAAHLCGFATGEEMLAASASGILASFDIFHEDGTPFPLERLPGRLALAGTASSAIVCFRLRPRGEERWSIISGAPVLDAAGNVELAVSVFREFTERRRTEQAWQFLAAASAALSSSLNYQETLSRVAELAVPHIADWCSVDVLGANEKLEQLAVAHVDPAKRELAREWRRRWPPRPDAASYRVVRSGLPDLVPEITEAMIEAGTPDPEQRRMALTLGLRSAMVLPLMVGQKPFGVISFVTAESGRTYDRQDLILATEIASRASLAVENARAYTEAQAAIQTRDNFLAIASHELRTPLSALTVLTSSLVRLAEQDRLIQLGSDGLKERMLRAQRQSRQLGRLVDQLLDVSRLSSRDLRLEREELDLAEVAREVVARYEDAAAEAGVQVTLSSTGPTVGRWDRSRLDQVLTNLIANALKYGKSAPVNVSVSASTSGYVRLTIRDQGPGIPAEHQERIFGQFERATTSEEVPGMGLGLWLVRRIVTAHGGTVTLDSRPGEGAAFSIVLPTSS